MKFLNDLWTGLTRNKDGSFSSTKFWQGVGYLTCMFVIIWLTLTDKMSAEYLLIMLAATAGGRSFQNYLNAKTGAKNEPAP